MKRLYQGVRNFLKDIYDVVIGDVLEHKRYVSRRGAVDELSGRFDLESVSGLNMFVREVESSLGIDEFDTGRASNYYDVETPQEFFRKRRKTIRRFERLKPLSLN